MSKCARAAIWLAGLSLVALSCSSKSSQDTLTRARSEGRMRLGFANEAPFAFRDPAGGELAGEAPAIARHALAELGVPALTGVLTEFGSLIPGLRAERFDMIAAGMYITPERCKQVLFSEPSYCVREALLVHEGNPLELHSYADIVRSNEVQLGVVSGTVELGHAQRSGVPPERLQIFPDPPSAFEGLVARRVDAYAATSLTAQDLLSKAKSAAVAAAEPFTAPSSDGEPNLGCGAFAFRREDRALRDAFDRELRELLASDAHRALVSPFGFGESTRVQGVTRASLCGDER